MVQVFFSRIVAECATIRPMVLRSAIGVRLDPDIRARLENVTSATTMSAGKIIRTALEQYLDKVEREGGVYMPIPGLGTSEPISSQRLGAPGIVYDSAADRGKKKRPPKLLRDGSNGAAKPAATRQEEETTP